ncbi:MAG: DUF5686 and carboxypeptidase regulatory-like domain-containing protein [Saprospiraceae bacterium]
MKLLSLIIGMFIPFCIGAQLYGTITDNQGETLPFVSIYIKGSSQGTSSNINGEYKLNLSKGDHQIVFQYVGMETIIKDISISDADVILNLTLTPQAALLSEITIAANAEDPAYRVIRNAQKKRKYFQNLIKKFSCDVYIKGNQKMTKAPKKMMGVEIGDLEGALDSNRQGIVYLSESISKLYYKSPHKLKEVVYSSKVSGDDNGYSFNTAREMELSIYDNTMDFSRQLVSPIAENAMAYYKYKLEGTFYEDGRLINKIKLIRKRETDPSFYGTVYIVEDIWNVHSIKVGVTSRASQLYFIDSIEIDQVFVPIDKPDIWRIFSNNISFKLGAFGFEMNGNFSATYSNYDLISIINDDFFNKEVFVVEKDSNKKDSIYWAENRPTPLTVEEKVDYIKKDSIQKVRDNPAYKDSIDRENNIFKIVNALRGYRHNRSSKHTYWDIGSPLSHLGYNTVQGYNASVDLSWWKYFDKEHTNRIILNGNVGYGFSEKKIRANGSIIYRPNRLNQSYITFIGGQSIKQINKFAPIDELRNTLYGLFARKNFPKYYGYEFAKLGLGKEVVNGINIRVMTGYEKRNSLVNKSDISYYYKDTREFTINNPWGLVTDFLEIPSFNTHEVMSLELYADIRFGQEYIVYPDRKYSSGNEGPLLSFKYRFLSGINNDISLHALSATLSDEITAGAYGRSEYIIRGGTIMQKNDLQIMDYFHFSGNQFTISDPARYGSSFLMLPYYTHSTDGKFVEAHYQHFFDGYIMDKVPGINKLGFGLVAGAKFLSAQGHGSYYEAHIGIDKIGWHILRILRFDVVMASSEGKIDWGYRIGVKIGGGSF